MTALPSKIEQSAMRTITWRLLPYLMLCYFVSYIDRINVGFAALQMRGDVNLSADNFGLGASLFLITYSVFSVPSNIALQRIGARRWIALIMFVWGLLSMGMALTTGPYSFYAFRLLIGATEAGFLPGVIFYISLWFPKHYRARVSALFLVAIPASSFVGSPLSGALMELQGWHGLSGWQWLFIFEGLPAAILALGCLKLLPDRPADARWLGAEARDWLQEKLESEGHESKTADKLGIWQTLCNRYVLALCLIYSGVISVGISLSLWQPQIIKSFGLSDFQTGMLSAIPFGVATLTMILWGRSSDQRDERTWHTAIPLALSGLALAASLVFHSLPATIVILTLALVGTYAAKGPFWAMVTQWLSSSTAATGIAVVSSAGSLAAALSTYLLGVIQQKTGSFSLALLPLIALALVGTLVLFAVGVQNRRELAARNAASA
jgi:ACS family tartrate transporter-like MFS transporter